MLKTSEKRIILAVLMIAALTIIPAAVTASELSEYDLYMAYGTTHRVQQQDLQYQRTGIPSSVLVSDVPDYGAYTQKLYDLSYNVIGSTDLIKLSRVMELRRNTSP